VGIKKFELYQEVEISVTTEADLYLYVVKKK
jgi:hypothetical protein